jgi:hypothetical protein
MAGSITTTLENLGNGHYLLTYNCIGDASNGGFPSTGKYPDIDGYLERIVTNPGATTPTDNYDIAMNDEDGVDVMGGALVDRDQTNSEDKVPLDAGAKDGRKYIKGPLTPVITNNSVNSAIVVIKCFISRR